MTDPRDWLDLSPLGLRLRLVTTPVGRPYHVIGPARERPDLEGAIGQPALNLVNIGFHRVTSTRDGRRNHVRPVRGLPEGSSGIADIKAALPGAVTVAFDPEVHAHAMLAEDITADDKAPEPVLRRLAAEMARHAFRHGLDAEAALREAMSPFEGATPAPPPSP